jgi:hypothetical protein
LHGSSESISEGKKPMYIIVKINASNQLVTVSETINLGSSLTNLQNFSKENKIIHQLGCSWLTPSL